MGVSIPFDDFVTKLYLSRTRIVDLSSEILHKLPYLNRFSLDGQIQPNGPDTGNSTPKVVKTSWGEEIGYLVHMNSFPRKFFADPEVDLIDYSDRRNKDIHRGAKHSRKKGGVYDKHPLDILDVHYRVASEVAPQLIETTGISLDSVLRILLHTPFFIAKKRHDDFEDHKDVEDATNEFKETVKKAMQVDPTLTKTTLEYKNLLDSREEVKKKRAGVVNKEYTAQTEAISDIADRYSLDDRERSKLLLVGDIAIGVIDWSARHIEETFFTGSMFRLTHLYSIDDYVNQGRGGPFQTYLMGRLGIKHGKEPLDYLAGRMYLRLLDRIVLSRERKPRYKDERKTINPLHNEWWKAKELESLFNKYQFLREIYGEGIEFRVEEAISRPDLLDTLYRNSVVLKNVDFAVTRYGGAMVKQQKRNPVAYAYLLAILKAREYLIQENMNIINELKPSYKRDLGRKGSREVEERVLSLPSLEFEMVTGEGPISNGFRYETGMRINKENGDEFQVRQNYQDLLAFEQLTSRFLDPQRNLIDTKKGKFSLFVIEGLEDGISFALNPRPYRRV